MWWHLFMHLFVLQFYQIKSKSQPLCCAVSFLFIKMRAGKICLKASGSKSVQWAQYQWSKCFNLTEKSCLCFQSQQNETRSWPAAWHGFSLCSCSSIIIAPVLARTSTWMARWAPLTASAVKLFLLMLQVDLKSCFNTSLPVVLSFGKIDPSHIRSFLE